MRMVALLSRKAPALAALPVPAPLRLPANVFADSKPDCAARNRLDGQQLIPGFLDPQGYVGLGAGIRGDYRNDLTLLGGLQAANKLHQRSRAVAAARVNLSGNHHWTSHTNHLRIV